VFSFKFQSKISYILFANCPDMFHPIEYYVIKIMTNESLLMGYDIIRKEYTNITGLSELILPIHNLHHNVCFYLVEKRYLWFVE